jgi:hypothetical protein
VLSDGSIGVYRRRRNQSGQPLALREGERGARFLRSGPRFCLDGSTPLSHLYEIDILTPLTPVWSDRIPRTELASSEKKSDVEIEGMKKYLGMK